MNDKTALLSRWCGVAAFAALLVIGCGVGDRPNPSEPAPSAPSTVAHSKPPPGHELFVDIAAETGLDFVHWNGMTGKNYFVEPVGAGGALVDLDNDGDLDVYLVQGCLLKPKGADSIDTANDDTSLQLPITEGGRIFRNDLIVGDDTKRQPRFVDVTANSGLVADRYGMGVASGDFDNDGRTDLYLTNLGSNQLWRNISHDGQILFEDVTAESNTDDTRWSTSATFVDLDADGWLDLYIANYVNYRLETHRPCRSPGGRQDYCGPQTYSGEPDRVLYNRGNGTFTDITGAAGMLAAPSSGLGVVAADFDLDGRIDLYVANDLQRNFLWHNLGQIDGLPRFGNTALECGSAVSSEGRAQASMGLVAEDLDNDGDDDLFMTHLSADTNTLYINMGNGFFEDRSAVSKLGMASLANTCFGAATLDIDNDGWLDIVTANGEIRVIEALVKAGDPYPLKQRNQLYRNLGNGTFADISDTAGEEFARLEVSRGIAIGDIDNDGKSDILLVNNNGPARLLHNRDTGNHAWIGFRVLVKEAGRDALGARVAVIRPDGSALWRRVATDGSYLSARDPRVLFGLGTDARIAAVRVVWPGGENEEWSGLEAGHYYTLIRGQGRTLSQQAP